MACSCAVLRRTVTGSYGKENAMVIVGFTLLGLLLIVLQTTVCMLHPAWPAAPDFYYILVAYLAYRIEILRSLIVLFFLGCILDVFSGVVLGMYSLICFGAFFLLRFVAKKMPVSESLYQVPLVGVSYLVVMWGGYVFISFFEPAALVPWSWWKMLLRAALIVVFAYPLFHFLDFFYNRVRKGLISWKKLKVKSDNRYRT